MMMIRNQFFYGVLLGAFLFTVLGVTRTAFTAPDITPTPEPTLPPASEAFWLGAWNADRTALFLVRVFPGRRQGVAVLYRKRYGMWTWTAVPQLLHEVTEDELLILVSTPTPVFPSTPVPVPTLTPVSAMRE